MAPQDPLPTQQPDKPNGSLLLRGRNLWPYLAYFFVSCPMVFISLLPAMMAINADVPAKTVKDFVALTKANPGKYLFSSSGNGSAPQLFGEQFKIVTGASMTHVPYKGSGPAVVDLG